MTTNLPPNQRRSPRQARARATWEAIVEAAAQILERRGPDAFNTNEVAERAGVSIGTLYQYFPDKHAILAAAARRHLGPATGLAARQRALIEAMIAFVERLGGAAAASTSARRSASPGLPSTRRPTGDARLVDVLAELLIGPAPALVPIAIRRPR